MIKLIDKSRNTLHGKEEGYDIVYPDGTVIWCSRDEVNRRLQGD